MKWISIELPETDEQRGAEVSIRGVVVPETGIKYIYREYSSEDGNEIDKSYIVIELGNGKTKKINLPDYKLSEIEEKLLRCYRD